MCNHTGRKELDTYPDENGMVKERCMTCGKITNELPYSFSATIQYCQERKIRSHFKNTINYLAEPRFPTRDGLERTYK